MTLVKTSYGRRSFLKTTALAGGGLMLGFSWLTSCQTEPEKALTMPDEWFELNGFLKIGENGVVTIQSPNPEIGQNIKTSMPMIVAEELDVDWDMVVVEQAPLNTAIFTRQIAGGSQSIRQGWEGLRLAGATARYMLCAAAAEAWQVPVEEISTDAGQLLHTPSGKSAGYGEFAAAAVNIAVPEEVELKDPSEFKIIGTSRKNVDGPKIVTGEPLYGLDVQREGMLIAMPIFPPAFGMQIKSWNGSKAARMPGIKRILAIETYPESYEKQWCDTDAFNLMLMVVGESTWQVMQARKEVEVEWEQIHVITNPTGLESSDRHQQMMADYGAKNSEVVREDGEVDAAFANAATILERTYTAPFLAHNTMEPMNFFAHVTADKAELIGPTQTPEYMEKSLAERLNMPIEQIDIQMTRMGGGFGRRLYGHFMVEAAVVSQEMKAPIKLVYSREDDMSFGTYRPAYHATYRAALDADKNLIGFHVRAGGIPETPLVANRFPAGAVDNYRAEKWSIDSNISVGAWRAPRSNFIAGAEQSFLDELAEAMDQDPIQMRLDLLQKAKDNPVGEDNDYDPARYAGVLELVRDFGHWGNPSNQNLSRGVSAYFCHNSYVAQILDMSMDGDRPVIEAVYSAVDCGIVVNPDAATNMIEGGIVDGIGHALYSGLTFQEGAPQQRNFDRYRLIRHSEAPKKIEVQFVDNGIAPTGLGEPPFPPIIAAVANAMYRATGERQYNQPFLGEKKVLG